MASAFTTGRLPDQRATRGSSHAATVDGPVAGLDVDNLGKVLLTSAEIPIQVIVTSADEQGLKGIEFGRRFHVEQGQIRTDGIIAQLLFQAEP